MVEVDLEKRKKAIDEINDLAIRINSLIERRKELTKTLQAISEELSKVEEEEKVKRELYEKMSIKYEGKIPELRKREKETTEEITETKKNVEELTKQFLDKFHQQPRPYPILDLENLQTTESQVMFLIKEGYRLSEFSYAMLLSQIWNTDQLSIGNIKFKEDQWIVDSNEPLDAMKKVDSTINTLEKSIEDVLNADEICKKRIHGSKSWGPALQLLYTAKKALSVKEVAERLEWKVNYAGATLTNLMKKEFWPVPLVERPSEGKYQLNGHGYVLMKRYQQLFKISVKEKEQSMKRVPSEKRPTKLENFIGNT